MKSERIWTWSITRSLFLFSIVWIAVQIIDLTIAETAFERDITLTYSQKLVLDKFKERVIDKLPHEYMKTDIYLIRWLRARNFDMDQAEQMLQENLKWRRNNKMDTVLEEDWTSFKESYPYYLDTKARDGKPILTGSFGDYDLRASAVAGNIRQVIRFLDSGLENATTLVRKMQEQGKNVSQYEVLVNMDHYNIVQHGCLSCIQFYLGLINSYENHYPLFIDNLIFFNTPPVFELVLRVIRPLMSPATRKSMRVFGQDRKQWSKALYEIADKNQLTPEYGGTFKRGN